MQPILAIVLNGLGTLINLVTGRDEELESRWVAAAHLSDYRIVPPRTIV